MENKAIYMVSQLSTKTVSGAIGYIPVFDDVEKAKKASKENTYAIKRMEMVDLNNVISMKRNKILNKIQNSKI